MDWIIEKEPVPYDSAISEMEKRVEAIRKMQSSEAVWVLEHPPLYTAGTSAKPHDLLSSQFPVYETGRGGEYTYHGPGQVVAYAMLDLKKRQSKPDIKHYIWQLEEWIIRSLRVFNVIGERREGRVGIWVVMPDGTESKVAAIGVRIRRWVTYHGIAINVSPDLSHFRGIVPCGISEHGVTSLKALGLDTSFDDMAQILRDQFSDVFKNH